MPEQTFVPPPHAQPALTTVVRAAAVVYVVLWVFLAFNPHDRPAWLLENALVVGLFGLLWWVRDLFRFSNPSLLLILSFLALHTFGSHYTYSEVPYNAWWQALTGHTFNSMFGWERNHYDRLVHFSYGLLLFYPIREFFLRIVEVRGFWAYFLPLDVALSTSALYELIEWAVAMAFGDGLGMQYLGTQGDVWDAHKDMALAGTGALLAMLITLAINWRLGRDVAWEWSQNLRKPADGAVR